MPHTFIITLRHIMAILAIGCVTTASAITPADIAKALKSIRAYDSQVRFTVSMPQLDDDVVYTLSLHQTPSEAADSLSPVSYLIDWTLTNKSDAGGFTAYIPGSHYRFDGRRLLEYHTGWDMAPFTPAAMPGRSVRPIHRSAQFANLLPAYLADDISAMAADSAYTLTLHPDTLIAGQHCTVLDATMTLRGITAMESEYVFDRRDLSPMRFRFENSPGSISEQSVEALYQPAASTGTPTTEQQLIARFPDAFENCRQSNFRIETLPGRPLPAFALPTTTGERHSRNVGDHFRAPTIVALLDASNGFTPATVSAIRDAVDSLPFSADIIWAFTDKHPDSVEAIIARPRPGEHLLMSARSLARDCGASSFPVIILTNTDGTVHDVILGFNNQLSSDVIQKMALMRR